MIQVQIMISDLYKGHLAKQLLSPEVTISFFFLLISPDWKDLETWV